MATQVEITNLNSWLQSQAANTVTTPYAIEITGLTSQNVENIRDILRNNSTKYVDLRETQIPFYSTEIGSLFLYCSTLVYSPKLPDGVERLISTFFQCSNLKEIPDIPSSCNYMSATFYECTSLTEAHISNSLRYMVQCFAGCTSLQKANIPPTYISENESWYPINVNNTFNGCSSLEEVSISLTNLPIGTQFSIGSHQATFNNCSNLSTFYSDQPYELKQWLTDNKSELKLSKNISNYYFRLLSSPAKISINKLNNELSALSDNAGGAYCIKITELQSTSDIATILKDNSTKYVDLSSTELAKNTNMYQFFKDCTSLVAAPVIPKGITELNDTFGGCTSLVDAPVIPEGVTDLPDTFWNCTALTNAPEIPNGVIDMSQTFAYCVSLSSAPTIPNSVTNMTATFNGCSSLLFVRNIPNSVVYMEKTFQECTSLVEISSFEADINTLLDNGAVDAFANCTSLTKIGVSSRIKESSEWHAFRLKFGASTVSGKVYDKTKTSAAISQTSITKTNLKLPILTDELWFPSSGTSDADIDEVIEKAIQYRYTYWNKDVLDPDKKNFVLWADDPDNSYSNLKINVASADKLSTARNLKVALGSSNAQSFDGSADAENIGVDGTLPVANGGTGQTTAKGAEYNIIGGVEQVTTAFDDNRYIAVRNQTVSDTNGTFRWFKVSNLWDYIKGKIQSIALTIGSTTSAIAETLYGSITVKNSSDATTASISQAGAITGTSATISGNVLGSNVPYFGTVYSSNTYSSGYYEIARLEGAAASGNHSIGMEGTVISDKTGTVSISDFYVFVRGNNATVSIAIFNCVGRYSNADLTATYEVFDTNKFRIRLYGKITGNWHRYNTVIKYASTGDVSDRSSNRTVIFPNAYVTAVIGTSITKNVNYAGNVTGSSGSCSGNSSTADTTRGTAYCTTDSATQAKVASMRGYVLQSGATFPITFTNANSYNGVITLNVNSTGAKNIYINNAVTSSSNKTLPAGTYLCRYNGSYYYIDTGYFATNARNANYATSAGNGVPVGTIIAYYGNTAPSGWLICDGTSKSVATYPALAALIGYPVGSTTFTLPDLCESVLVGIGTRGSGVTTHDTYTLGQFKDDQMQKITGKVVSGGEGLFNSTGNISTSGVFSVSGSTEWSGGDNHTYGQATTLTLDTSADSSLRTGTTTRTKQFGILYLIKY